MVHDKVIYTDERDVLVTNSIFKVKKASYRLSGITKHYFFTIRPDRWPGALLLLIGLGAAVAGYLFLVPSDISVWIEGKEISGNSVALYGGAGLFVLGLLSLIFARERYAVRIGTAEGDKNAIVSSKKEYVIQIVDALHSAFDYQFTTQPIINRK